MLQVSTTTEKSAIAVPTAPMVIPSNANTLVLPSIVGDSFEYCGRYIQNVGANDCYIGVGHECDKTNFNLILAKPGSVDANGYGAGQQFDASNIGCAIYVYSVGGTTLAIELIKRNYLVSGSGGIL